jgi:hypothetical protein
MPATLLRVLARTVVGIVLAAPSLHAGGARIVEAPGLPPFTDLQAAVDAASDGDSILVAGGTYAGFTIPAKSLRVVGVPGQTVRIAGTVTVQGLPASGHVLLSGLTVTGRTLPGVSEPGLVVTACAGDVRVEACALSGGVGDDPDWLEFGDGGHGVVLQASLRVAFAHCTLAGGQGGGDSSTCYDCTGGDGGLGVRVNQSTPAFYQCTLIGGAGGAAGTQGGTGGAGARLLNGWMFAAGSSFTGGRGGAGWDFIVAFGGDGGDGLVVDSTGEAQLLDCAYVAGEGGLCFAFPQNSGQPGAPQGGAGTFDEVPGRARALQTFRLVLDDGSLQVAVTGEPGDEVWVRVGRRPLFRPQPTLPGVHLLYPPPVPVVPAGVIPASGQLLLSLSAPELVADVDRLLYLQGFGRDASGVGWLGSPMHALVLDRQAGPDCNGNLQSDLADVLLGTSPDCGPNLVPDECDPDCDGNGVSDDCDISSGTQADCNANGIPDACDLAAGASPDCNANGVPDECDVASGSSADLNANGVPDECEGPITWWVDAAAPAGGSGSAASPFQTLGQAFAVALSGHEIVVRDGVYSGPQNRTLHFNGRELVVRSENGPAATVIDLQGLGWAFYVSGWVGPSTRIEGFTFLDGKSGTGGAIQVSLSDPVIRGCVFVDCRADIAGGALMLGHSGALVEDCTFMGNSTSTTSPLANRGGAIWVSSSLGDPPLARVRRCRFQSNRSADGGAICVDGERPLAVSHCEFLGNSASVSGGALSNRSDGDAFDTTVTVDDCLFAGNSAGQVGGALYARPGALLFPVLTRVSASTFAGNSAGGAGGAAAAEEYVDLSLVHCVLWDNSAPLGAQLYLDDLASPAFPPTVAVERCDLQGGQVAVGNTGGTLSWGAGNLDVDPWFSDPDGPDNDPATVGDNDYRPLGGAPVNDAGDAALIARDLTDIDEDGVSDEPVPLDLDGTARRRDDPAAPDVGAGPPPQVDLGCYERR